MGKANVQIGQEWTQGLAQRQWLNLLFSFIEFFTWRCFSLRWSLQQMVEKRNPAQGNLDSENFPRECTAMHMGNYTDCAECRQIISGKYCLVCGFSKPGFSNTWTVNFQMFKLVLEKSEEPESKLPTSAGHRKSKGVPEKHLFLLYWLCQNLWLCGSQ